MLPQTWARRHAACERMSHEPLRSGPSKEDGSKGMRVCISMCVCVYGPG